MTTEEQSYQMKLDLDIPEDEADVESGLSASQIQARKDVARAMVDSGEFFKKDDKGEAEIPFWFDAYQRNVADHYPFRVAVYMAWLGTPKSKRHPRTKKELADLLGLSSPRQFSVWESKNPQIEAQANLAWKKRIVDGLSDSVDAMLEVAAKPDYKGNKDRALHFKMAGELIERIELNDPNADLSKLSYEEKLKLAGLDDPAALEKFRQDVKEKLETEGENSDE